MGKEAKENFQKSKDYSIENINKRRYNFYKAFLIENELPIPNKLKNFIKEE